ncbi:MAG: amidohydrolase family protein [Zavarzinia sp.]|nr:amidohydrolase family protein [Zavarzinia sp.]
MKSFVGSLPLIDHHCHGVVARDLDRPAFEALMSEGHRPVPGCSQFDKPLGLALLRHCPPVLGLDPHAEPGDYLELRRSLGFEEVSRRLIGGNGVSSLLIDTGHRSDSIFDPARMTAVSGVPSREVVRIEAVMEEVARQKPVSGAALRQAFEARLAERSAGAVGLKSIVAYRTTFDIDQTEPSLAEVDAAGDLWLRQLDTGEAKRLEDAVLIRHGLYVGARLCREKGFPMQLHVGFGDRDVSMPKCDPTVFLPFIEQMETMGVTITLLHCWPFLREAAWLAEVFSNVYVDTGVSQNFTGASAPRVVAEMMELAPFHKQVYSSDAFGLAELHYMGALLFRDALADVLGGWIARGDLLPRRAEQIAKAIAFGNACRIYGLPLPASA